MKFATIFSLAAITQSASAHCKFLGIFPHTIFTQLFTDIWYNLLAGGTSSTAAVRKPLSNSPVESATSTNLRCNVNPMPATATFSVAAGSSIGFQLDNTIYHQGPAAIYLGKAPSTAAAWDGSGANWFKVISKYMFFSRNSYLRGLRSPNGARPSTLSSSLLKISVNYRPPSQLIPLQARCVFTTYLWEATKPSRRIVLGPY